MTVEIGKIEIKVAGKVLVLTLDQAKELRDILNDTFPRVTATAFPYPVVVREPVYIPQPIYPHWTTTPIWCGSAVGLAGESRCESLQIQAIN